MVHRMMVRDPDGWLQHWKIDMTLPMDDLPEFFAFCTASFGPFDPDFEGWPFCGDGLHSRWAMQLFDRLTPPWVELYFRDKQDVALLKLFYQPELH